MEVHALLLFVNHTFPQSGCKHFKSPCSVIKNIRGDNVTFVKNTFIGCQGAYGSERESNINSTVFNWDF